MIRPLRAFARLPSSDRRIVLRAIAALIASRWRSRLEPRRGAAAGADDTARALHVAALLVKTANNLPFRTTCLQHAAALAALLAREGIACDLRIAVRREGDSMEAHAWVEHHGTELLARAGEGFVVFDEALSLSSVDAPSLRAPRRRA